MRIAIAEDVPLLREGMAAILSRAGHEVIWTTGDADAVRALLSDATGRGVPDLLIVDVRMPPRNADDGLRAAVDLRVDRPGVGILVVSQHIGNAYARELLATAPGSSGGTGYLLKERIGDIAQFLDAVDVVAAGGTVIDDKVVAQLLATPTSRRRMDPLTARESEVLALVAEGRTNHQIERRLHLSAPTVEKHVSSIFQKSGLTAESGNRRVLAVLRYLDGDGAGPAPR
ncbi:Transcriptional regulatory protein DegU [Clavibacter michiganensis]|uniref:Transcriptional regulatory protein DegU n=1 Tax=Clavibacter michiganensis TaxID=28447 RepID=A0A251Y7Z5_9MICO|nr:response regulator transcription factor [Clavibacter michiganensis]OUE20395.1 Transcriptional regulatory protein DegU [Clavibacter michiganensis]